MVEFDIEWKIDLANRRRSQNRIAQRRFRESRKKPKSSDDRSNQPPCSGCYYSIVETDSIAAPDVRNYTALNAIPLNNFVETIGPTDKSDTSMTDSRNLAFNNSISRIENLDFINSFISANNSSLLTPQITNFQSDFDQQLNFASLHASESTSTESGEPENFNSYGTLSDTISTTHSDTARHGSPGHVSYAHPAMGLTNGVGISREKSLVESSRASPTASLPKENGQSKGWLNPLHIAARRGHEAIIRTLISHNIDCNETDSDSRTALIHASIHGHEPVVCLLLAHGARISAVDRRGRSALYWATMNQHEAVLRLLLREYDKRGWEQGIDAYDDMGWTALHIAIDRGFDVGVQLLLASGADLNAKARKSCKEDDDDDDDGRIVQAT
ncbi:hypothetical protein MFRU_006g01090 [Monilinia fructicola]|nr:hypothetical protein MFRU_006g01090 [Monilinia fructicola]